jgi:hypothetical protein
MLRAILAIDRAHGCMADTQERRSRLPALG